MERHVSKQWWFGLLTHSLIAVVVFVGTFRAATGLPLIRLPLLFRSPQSVQELSRLNNAAVPTNKADKVDFSLFWEVWNRLERDYVDPSKIDAQQMVYGAIAGMTQALGDPYTVFLPPETKQRLTEDLQGEFDGVGIQLGYRNGQLAIISPLKDHPAERAGVKAGDYIVRIKDKAKNIDKETIGMSTEEAVGIIRGKKGTPITLTILTEGQDPREIELVRETIEIPSIETEVVEHEGKRYAHIKLNRFGDKTTQEWEGAVATVLADKNISGIILDLRNNPGGYLEASIDIASDFIDGGVVVSQKGRVATQSYSTTRRARLSKYPVEVLVNKGSASASEIVAGALRDRKSAKLIGEQTFGKGTVQDAQQLNDGAGLNVTIARWLLPSGESIQDTGIPVTIEVTDDPNTETDEVLQRALVEIQ